MLLLRRGGGLVARPLARRLAVALEKGDHGKGGKGAAPRIVPVWQTTESFKTLSDLPSREVLKAELMQMAEDKNGFLFGEVPPPPGQSRKWEDWEFPWYFGMGGCLLYAAIGLAYKPDCKIQTWARGEAIRRKNALEEQGGDWLALMAEGGAAPPVEDYDK
ncbi:ESSS subunit of NADH:ubiquinone oxidoreductase-domain-containing protein [Pavlovales sp. CCMP2436]|nr:ESSS subunit of NADH:ubiquinone oxidoreductase-domain-containing protein [Pavlovales sp. CCMP2436]